jgi:hypothetical protein
MAANPSPGLFFWPCTTPSLLLKRIMASKAMPVATTFNTRRLIRVEITAAYEALSI